MGAMGWWIVLDVDERQYVGAAIQKVRDRFGRKEGRT